MTVTDREGSATPDNAGATQAGGDTAGEDRAGSLLPVIRVIPKSAYENPTWKGLAFFARDLAFYGLVLWGIASTDNPLLLVALWTFAAVVVSGLFIIGHDAAHEALFKSRRLNSVVGHLAMLPSWHVYEAWVLGHNRIHHGHTVREGMDFVWHPVTPEQYGDMGRLQRARHRVEWSWWGAGAYYLREIWFNKMITFNPPAKWAKSIRRDLIFMFTGVALGMALFGWIGWLTYGSAVGVGWMIVKAVVIPFLGFNFVIGSVVHAHHVQPSIRWWSRREWTKFRGQVEGTTIMRAPWVLDLFFHSIMVHIPHHVDMRIPFYGLEPAAAAIKAEYPDVVHDEKLRFRDFVRNTRACKLYDFADGRWMTYDQGMDFLMKSSPDELAARERRRFAKGSLVG
jgi:omega-6 fatty acid desaturase (delta-12 desaturase)